MEKNNNIENIFKEKFENFSQTPPEKVWDNISDEINIKNYLKFTPNKINIYYVTLAIALIIFAIFYNLKGSDNINKQKQLTSIINKKETKSTKAVIIKKTKKIVDVKTKSLQKPEKLKIKSTITNTVKNKKDSKTNVLTFDNYEETIMIEEKVEVNKLDATFTINSKRGCVPHEVKFNCKEQANVEFNWDFGNGKKSNKINPTVVYKTAGVFSAILTVKSGSFSETYTQKITVLDKPNPNFSFNTDKNIFENQKISIINNSENAESYKWDFGDGYSSEIKNPNHIYSKKGDYKIKLITYSKENCIDSVMKNITIKDQKYIVLAPTGFTPNISGQNNGTWQENSLTNDIFYIRFNYDVAEYAIKIFNRRGQLVYEGKDIKKGWNGYYKGQLSAQGVYVWKCYGKFIDGTVFRKTGNVTMLISK